MTGRHDDRGFVGGVEGLLFGVLVCLLTALLSTTVWGAVRARVAAGAAAREATRAFVEASTGDDATASALAAAHDTLTARGRDVDRSTVVVTADGFARCTRVVVEVAYELPAVELPFVGAVGAVTVHGRHSELVDPHRDDVPGEAVCGA